MKKILVTGHNGYIGPHLVRLLLEKGYSVVGIDTNYFDKDCRFYIQEFNDNSSFEENIKDLRKINESDFKDIFAVCHLAGLSNDIMGDLDENLTYDINHQTSVKIATLAKAAGVDRFIFSSSCSLYGIADGNIALDETAGFAPVTAYAKSKVLTERDVLPLADDNYTVTFLRNATAYGVSPKLRTDLVVNNLLGWALTKGKIRIMSDGTPWRPIVHCEDIARAFVAMIEAPKTVINGQAFNIGINSENFRVIEIAEKIKEAIPECEIEITNEHGGDSRSYRVNFEKVKKLVPGFEPKWTLVKGIQELLQAYKLNNLTFEDFNSRKHVRIMQLKHLLENQIIDSNLYFKK
jgi:nucleoside-diphosphate-sugar epimerase